jgi:hypothetical protein
MSEAVESPKTGHAGAPPTRERREVSTLTVVTTLVMLLVFLGLVWIVFLQKQAIPTSTDEQRAERLKNLAQLNADNQKILTTYHWVDKSKGIVGIPINRAMQLVLKDLAANHPHAADLINPPAASPTPAASPAPAAANQQATPAASPVPAATQQQATPAPSASATPAPSPVSSPSSSPEPTASPQTSASPEPTATPETSASPEQSSSPEPTVSPNPSTSPAGT